MQLAALSPKDQFLAQLPFIERVIGATCRRHSLFGDDADDFRSFVHEKLIEDDYATFRKFRGTSSLQTYLTAVIMNRFRDYRVHRWGKWRPSAKAKRLGPLAVQLETLLSRDGLSLTEALETLQARSGRRVTRRELALLAAELPARPPRRIEGEGSLAAVSAAERTDALLVETERLEALMQVQQALERALHDLPEEDRVITRMRFLDGFTVAQIARSLGLDQKPLYARVERNLEALRRRLEGDGVTAEAVREILG